MKKYIYLLMLAVTGMVTSCDSNDITDSNAEEPVRIFTAETEITGSTRTSLTPELNIHWESGDHIAIFNKNTNPEDYMLVSGEGKCNGSFSRNPESEGSSAPGAALSHVVAVYPYGNGYEVSGSENDGFKVENVEIPEEQYYTENNFPDRAMPMVAVTASNKLKFKNVGALLKLHIKGSDVDRVVNKITIESRSATKQVIAGKSIITAGADGRDPSIVMKEGGSTMITLYCNNVFLSPDNTTTFFIAVPPMNYADGFVVTIYNQFFDFMTLKTKPVDLKRNQIMDMPDMEFAATIIEPEDFAWVDMALPSGTKWANMNLGAKYASDYGDYFAWGETEPRTDYTENNYKLIHINDEGIYEYEHIPDIQGNPKYDAATAILGKNACTPNMMQVNELLDPYNCKWTWTFYKGSFGYFVLSYKNNNSIFIPCAGTLNPDFASANEAGYYWTSIEDHNHAFILNFNMEVTKLNRQFRSNGMPVRAVYKK